MATYPSFKLPLWALLCFSAGLLFGVVVLELGLSLYAILPLMFAWFLLALGARRVLQFLEKGCFLRAGPSGLSLRLPGPARRRTLWLTYDLWEYEFAWDEVNTLTWELDWDRSRNLVLHARGGRLLIDGGFFKEPVPVILDNIRRAAAPVKPPIPKTTL